MGDRLKIVFIALVALAILLRAYVFFCSVKYIGITGDEAITALQAKHILQGKFSLLVYAQPYEFPLETYFYAILRYIFPIRFQTLVTGVLTSLLFVLILLKCGKIAQFFPTWLIVLFPSAYLMITHFAYSTPHTAFAYIPVLLAMYLIFIFRDSVYKVLVTFFSGVLCGLSLAENFAVIAFVFPLFLSVLLNEKTSRLKTPLFFILGMLLGLMPLFLALYFYPDAYKVVSKSVPLDKALINLKTLLFYSLPKALGISPPLYPDTSRTLAFGKSYSSLVSWVFIILLLFVTLVRLKTFVTLLIKERKIPEVLIYDIFILATWIGIVGVISNARFASHNFRYLHPITYSFPFLIAYLSYVVLQPIRNVLTFLCALLAIFNVVTTIKLCDEWKKPLFNEEVVEAYDLSGVIAFLKEKQITHAIATHWQCYRLNYLTDEKIICSQPWNERFRGWQLPYKDRVDAATNVAIILENKKNKYGFSLGWFMRSAYSQNIIFSHTNIGNFTICWDFQARDNSNDSSKMRKLAISSINFIGITNNALWLKDGIRNKCIEYHLNSKKFPCSFEISFSERAVPSRINIFYCPKASINFQIKKIAFKNEHSIFEEIAPENYVADFEPFIFENNHPIFGYIIQRIMLKEIPKTDGLFIEGVLVVLSAQQFPFAEIEAYSY